ncbi:MAG TPA: 3-phosphoshikimate 1-carboxyvinyltransferase [Actinomycetota bacterium]|nr:3-phosphoshikimate 1-carboxyvinyltransferase [Actinomycetota bacterium]
MTDRRFPPSLPLRGTLRMPGDKSISHRALILGSMAAGPSRIRGLADGLDVASTRRCITDLGAEATGGPADVIVKGWSQGPLDRLELDCGNSGTTMRLLAGVLAWAPGKRVMRGDESLARRPMLRIVDPLREMGARIESDAGHAPLTIEGGPLHGIDHTPSAPSSQVKSCVLLAGMGAEGATSVTELSRTRDHTERMLKQMGARIHETPDRITIEAGPLSPLDCEVPGDVSSAAFLIVAALLIPGSELRIEGVGLNETRTGFLRVLARMGADILIEVETTEPEPVGAIEVRSSRLVATHIAGRELPGLDEVPILALAGAFAEGATTFIDVGDLRHKESDRVSSTCEMLRTLGVEVQEHPEGLVVHGGARPAGGAVDPAQDHRIALTAAVAGMASRDGVVVADWESASVSYPGFESSIGSVT